MMDESCDATDLSARKREFCVVYVVVECTSYLSIRLFAKLKIGIHAPPRLVRAL